MVFNSNENRDKYIIILVSNIFNIAFNGSKNRDKLIILYNLIIIKD